MKNTEYPKQINSIIHKNGTGVKTLSVESFLASPTGKSEDRKPTPPLEMHEGFSIFKMHLINSINKNIISVNIPAKDVPYIHKLTSSLIMSSFIANSNKTENKTNNLGLAYTYKFNAGKLAGKTPASIIIEENGTKTLTDQLNWIENNLYKYVDKPIYSSILSQIDAIKEAIDLFNNNKLNKELSEMETTTSDIITIYKTVPKNCSPKDEEGRYTVYSINISYDKTKNLPILIDLNSCFAPVDKSRGNIIEMSKAVNKKNENIRLSLEEWFSLIDTMKAHKIMFEGHSFKRQYEIMNEIIKENKENNKLK